MPQVTLPDGAQIGYTVLGVEHQSHNTPLVFVGGVGSLQGDFERLAASLACVRTVLVYDHRGVGVSKLAARDDEISIESLACDLVFLLKHLGWKQIAICGFSMGGLVAQQVLFLPYHSVRPTPLPFRVTHVVLAGTFCSVLRDKRYGLRLPEIPNRPLTEQEKLDIARPNVELSLDPKWLSDPRNKLRFDDLLRARLSGRPQRMMLKQLKSTMRIEFTGMHAKLPHSMQFLVIHGDLDSIIPPYCGQEILQRIPWAKPLEVGRHRGAVESLQFGHLWFEYFDIQVWHDVFEQFLASWPPEPARL